MRITFHGAAGCVTGSRFLVEADGARVLVDCGLFQGWKVLRERNWKPLPFDPATLDAVLLTHAHIDHSGFLPALVRDGFDGPIRSSSATRDLCEILLPDSGHIQEEDARRANEKRYSKHVPALPLYTEEDARRCLSSFRPVEQGEAFSIGSLTARLRGAGHILGASSVELETSSGTVLFSGDLGRENDLLMPDPDPPGGPDWIVLESTYGDRLHEDGDVVGAFAAPVRRALERGGTVLVPSFAVGRTQALLRVLSLLFERGELPRVPVYVDSPMATDVTELYSRHASEHKLSPDECRQVFGVATYTRSVDESKAIDQPGPPRIVISASGMLSGGRVLHHLKVFAPHAENLILLVGFQARGTRGAALLDGAGQVKVHGAMVPVRAEVLYMPTLSAHADRHGLTEWVRRASPKPRGVYLVHGEPDALDSLRLHLRDELGVDAHVADHGETVQLRRDSSRSA
jgi:metallo-beta-lactamase family protein